jgi:hypothetical protein
MLSGVIVLVPKNSRVKVWCKSQVFFTLSLIPETIDMAIEKSLDMLLKQYEEVGDKRNLVIILRSLMDGLKSIRYKLKIMDGTNPNDKVLQEMHLEILKLTSFKDNIIKRIGEVWKLLPDEGIPDLPIEPITALDSLADWIKNVKNGIITKYNRK